MATWDALRELTVAVDAVATETLAADVGTWVRKTTVLHLHGLEHEGLGEDVTYDADEHDRFPHLELAGTWTLESLSAHIGSLALFAPPPTQGAYLDYRRWAIESAALDLALRQAGTTLARQLGREPEPLDFVVSTRAGSLDEWVALYPAIRFKLDPTPEWSDELFAQLATWGNVDVLDLKGAYHGTVVDNPPDPELYGKTATVVPTAGSKTPR